MSPKADRGTKRTCQSCGSRFYDLNRDPIACPMCEAVFVMSAREYKAVQDAEAIAEEAAALKAAAKAAAAAKQFPAAAALPEGEDLPEIAAGDELGDIETSEEIAPGEGEETFLVEEEDGGDVSGLLDGPIEGEEEEA